MNLKTRRVTKQEQNVGTTGPYPYGLQNRQAARSCETEGTAELARWMSPAPRTHGSPVRRCALAAAVRGPKLCLITNTGKQGHTWRAEPTIHLSLKPFRHGPTAHSRAPISAGGPDKSMFSHSESLLSDVPNPQQLLFLLFSKKMPAQCCLKGSLSNLTST